MQGALARTASTKRTAAALEEDDDVDMPGRALGELPPPCRYFYTHAYTHVYTTFYVHVCTHIHAHVHAYISANV